MRHGRCTLPVDSSPRSVNGAAPGGATNTIPRAFTTKVYGGPQDAEACYRSRALLLSGAERDHPAPPPQLGRRPAADLATLPARGRARISVAHRPPRRDREDGLPARQTATPRRGLSAPVATAGRAWPLADRAAGLQRATGRRRSPRALGGRLPRDTGTRTGRGQEGRSATGGHTPGRRCTDGPGRRPSTPYKHPGTHPQPTRPDPRSSTRRRASRRRRSAAPFTERRRAAPRHARPYSTQLGTPRRRMAGPQPLPGPDPARPHPRTGQGTYATGCPALAPGARRTRGAHRGAPPEPRVSRMRECAGPQPCLFVPHSADERLCPTCRDTTPPPAQPPAQPGPGLRAFRTARAATKATSMA